MTLTAWIEIAFFFAALTLVTPLLGAYMARVYSGRATTAQKLLGGVERRTYSLIGVNASREQNWKSYAKSVLLFSAASFAVLYLILRAQSVLPFNPENFGAMPWDVTFNTVSSFVSNTNWQFYSGESALSYGSQMLGLTVQNFVSAGVGMAVLVAMIRGFARRETDKLGNFWQDMIRSILYILLPLSILGAVFLLTQGVVQSLDHYVTAKTLGGSDQLIALGPAASQISIKQLGTNGGGFFGVNSAFPFENPTGLSNWFELFFILLIPAGSTAMFGRMVGSRRQGWAVYGAMFVLLIASVGVGYAAESHGSEAQQQAGIATTHGGNMEGKEQRFGIAGSTTWSAATSAASNGSVNSSLDAYTPIGGLAPMANIMTGEVVFGGVGSGLYGMLMFAILAVFLAGLMVGRTPEYLGKKIGAKEIKLVMIGTLVPSLVVLIATAVAISTKYGAPSIFNSGPQGFSETLYAYASQANNNGSAFAGFTGFIQPNAPGNAGSFGITFANLVGGFAMLVGRFLPLLCVLAIGGSLAEKRLITPGPGTMRTDTPTFVGLLVVSIVLLALLNFVPAALLGPVVQSLGGGLY
jgi:K+-transporting ATPase ATPase A chain